MACKLAEGLPSFLLMAGRSAQDNSSRLFIILCATVRTTHRQSLQLISAKMQTFEIQDKCSFENAYLMSIELTLLGKCLEKSQ